MGKYWHFYHELSAYRQSPSGECVERLREEFVELFSTQTGYDALDERMAKTLAKKESLLAVLDHPEIPLHNNPAELGARRRVRKRVISVGTKKEMAPEGILLCRWLQQLKSLGSVFFSISTTEYEVPIKFQL